MSNTEGRRVGNGTGPHAGRIIARRPSPGGGGAWVALTAAAVLVAGCAGQPDHGQRSTQASLGTTCRAAAPSDAWVGNWMGVNKRNGVVGELHVLLTLKQDGAMAYAEQLKRAGKPPQALNETGCWWRDGESLVLRTTHSNAVAVEQGDPIYTNEYEVQMRAGRLVLNGPEGPLSLKRMPDDYRMPMF